ncbi:MAG: thrombospondin type 3 repeat-containing protein, partial [Nitrosospira sp.]
RNLDPNGKLITQAGYTGFKVQGGSLIAPINTSSVDMAGWRAWNDSSPRATVSVGACTLPCVRLVAGVTSSLLSSPNFSIQAGRWYRLTFDMKTTFDNQKVVLSPRRGGGGTNGYELFTNSMTTIYGTADWKRHSLLVESTLTIQRADPLTGDAGARIDFQNIKPGEEITIANLEMVPLLPVGSALRTALLSNPTSVEMAIPCPDEDVAPTACSQYVSFANGTAISWPHSVAPYSSLIVYTQDATLIDSDGDGIADIQDQCPETPQSSVANSLGCPFSLGS